MDDNPELVQPEDWLQPTARGKEVPIFLIHDGGGTTFAYHCLEAIGRQVYGIHNPHFHTEDVFEGGIPEMGRLYSSFIKNTITDPDFAGQRKSDGSVDILLGGWSMGGLLSLEVSRNLAEDFSVNIIGILMMDSVYPFRPTKNLRIAPPDYSEEDKPKNKILSQRAMKEPRRMITDWTLPVWDGHLTGRRPPISLLRAIQHVPQDTPGTISFVDVYRGDRNLGWDKYEKNMFTEIVDVNGHHFNMFSFEFVPGISASIKAALEELEMVAWAASR